LIGESGIQDVKRLEDHQDLIGKRPVVPDVTRVAANSASASTADSNDMHISSHASVVNVESRPTLQPACRGRLE
ncbi:hypothetical protein Q9189_007039, partial [Teloschistes chrysophthalmus]